MARAAIIPAQLRGRPTSLQTLGSVCRLGDLAADGEGDYQGESPALAEQNTQPCNMPEEGHRQVRQHQSDVESGEQGQP